MPLWKCSTHFKVIQTIKDFNSKKEMGLASPEKEKSVPGKMSQGPQEAAATHTTVNRAI